MARDTLLGFPAHTLPYRCGGFTTLLTVSNPEDHSGSSGFSLPSRFDRFRPAGFGKIILHGRISVKFSIWFAYHLEKCGEVC